MSDQTDVRTKGRQRTEKQDDDRYSPTLYRVPALACCMVDHGCPDHNSLPPSSDWTPGFDGTLRLLCSANHPAVTATVICSSSSKNLARAVRPVPIKVLTITKKNSKGASLMAGERVLRLLTPDDYVVVLDERGKDLTSEGMATLLADAGDRGLNRIVFCIGGPYGHSQEVQQRGSKTIRLSAMVLNHQVAHVVLLEQIYRGWTILRGEPYHH
ncbi:uncharacterized protein LOC142358028 [Convolutriloba macropyga]|uniref:uncharacterized protein LOC142358028 n=1 Tax=Convolutriloba macropyga TaxID=536237 RepID=UPI003F51C48C